MNQIALLIFCLASAEVFACGGTVTSLVPGSKVAGIQLSERGKSFYALDDDGVLAGSLAAAYCNQDIPYVNLSLSLEQEKCVNEAQSYLPHDKRVSAHYTRMNPVGVAAVKERCNFDMAQMLEAAEDKKFSAPLPCAPKVKEILRKAADRAAAYSKEYEARLKQTILSRTDVTDRMAEMNRAVATMEKLAATVAKPDATMKDFNTALKGLPQLYRAHTYQVVDKMDDANKQPKEFKKLDDILFKVNARLPDLMMAKCGNLLGDELIQTLNKIDWKLEGGAGGSISR